MSKDKSIIIEESENGFIIKTFEQYESETETPVYREVTELIEDEEGMIESGRHPKSTTKRLLEIVAHWSGEEEERYRKDNLSIKFNKKGRKYEKPEKVKE